MTTKKTTAKSSAKTAPKTEETARRLRVPTRILELQKRSIERQRSMFDTTFQAVQSFQEGRESAIQNLLESSSFVPKEWRLIAETWIDNAQKSRDGFREAVDASFGFAEQFVERLADEAPAKA